MNQHVTVLGALLIAFGIFGLVVGGFVFFLLTGIGWMSGDTDAVFVLSAIGSMVGFFFLLASLPSLIGGIALLRRAVWARILVLIVAGLNLLNFPIGTALAIYAFWVLTRPDVMRELENRPAAPPPPAVGGMETHASLEPRTS